jgi:ABC-2 type transport system permease protein
MGISRLRVREVVRKEARQMFRDPRMKPLVFVAPIIQLLLFGYAVNTDITNTGLFVVDQDRTVESRRLIDGFTSTVYFRKAGESDRSADLVDALNHGRAVIGIEIAPGFSADVKAGRGAQVQVVVDGTNSNTGTIAQGYATQILREYSVRSPGGVSLGRGAVDLRVRAWYNAELRSRVYNVPAVIGMLLLLMCLLLTALAVVRERELGTLDQLMVSPLQPAELMLGKTIPVAVVGLIDLALITVVAVFWFQIPFRGSLLELLPAALIYIVAGLAAGLLISTISRTQQEAFMTMFLFILPAIILSGFFYPISSMPLPFQWLTLANPVRHFIEIVRGIFLKGTGIVELWPQYLALVTMAAGGLWLAVQRFKRTVA